MVSSEHSEYIYGRSDFKPRLHLTLGGSDVSGRLLYTGTSGGRAGYAGRLPDTQSMPFGVRTDAVLDYPLPGAWTKYQIWFYLDNGDGSLDPTVSNNFFTTLDHDASGFGVPIVMSASFEGASGGASDAVVIFVGLIEGVRLMPGHRCVEVYGIDTTLLLHREVLEDFGRQVNVFLNKDLEDAPDYTPSNPVFRLPRGTLPVSLGSVTARVLVDTGGSGTFEDIEVLPALPSSGFYSSYRYAALDVLRGQILFGGEPPEPDPTSDGGRVTVSVSYKGAYRYRSPDALAWLIAENSGFYSGHSALETSFAKTLFKTAEFRSERNVFSSHGRPTFQNISPVIRWIDSDATGVYLGGDRYIFRHVGRDDVAGTLDELELVATVPDGDATVIQFLRVEDATNDVDGFFVLTVSDWTGRLAKLWFVYLADASSTEWTWDEISGADATASVFYDYDPSRFQSPTADNRKSMVYHDGYLYYVFANNNPVTGRNGIRRYHRGNDAVSDILTGGVPTDWSWDFAIDVDNSRLYAFYVARTSASASELFVYQLTLSGSGDVVYHGTFSSGASDIHVPTMVSDALFWRDQLYFVLTYRSRLSGNVGSAELCRITLTGASTASANDPATEWDDTMPSRRWVLATFENALYASRGLMLHTDAVVGERLYFVTGTWLSALPSIAELPEYPDAGYLYAIDRYDMIVDLGPVWRSRRDVGGRGMHTAFPSNIYSDGDVLHLIAGWGLIADPPITDDDEGSVATEYRGDVRDPSNFVWLQYGYLLAGKISTLPTNGRNAWAVLEELARVVDFEVGITSGENEIAAYKAANPVEMGQPELDISARGYLFFRPRSYDDTSVLELGSSDIVAVRGYVESQHVYNRVSVSVGEGVWISTDAERSEDTGVRAYDIRTDLLSADDVPWAEILAKQVLDRHKESRILLEVVLKFSPQIVLGMRLRIHSEYSEVGGSVYRCVGVSHDTRNWQTEIKCREEYVVPVELKLPFIPDYEFGPVVTFREELPEATGGSGDLTYTLTGRPTWMNFNANTRVFDGRTVTGTSELTYTVTDAAGATASRVFNVIVGGAGVTAGVVTFGDASVTSPVLRLGCYQQGISLPTATGGTPPLSYNVTGLPDGLAYDVDRHVISGVPTTAVVDAEATLTAISQQTLSSATLNFKVSVLERPDEFVGIGVGSDEEFNDFALMLSADGKLYRVTATDGLSSQVVDVGSGPWFDMSYEYNGEQRLAYLLSTNVVRVYEDTFDSLEHVPSKDINIGSGEWRGVAVGNSALWVLDSSENIIKVWSFLHEDPIANPAPLDVPRRVKDRDISLGLSAKWTGLFHYRNAILQVILGSAGLCLAFTYGGFRYVSGDILVGEGVSDLVGADEGNNVECYLFQNSGDCLQRYEGEFVRRDREGDIKGVF